MGKLNCAIVGAGVMGRVMALSLLSHKHQVTIFDAGRGLSLDSTSAQAGGMLAPFSEAEKSEPEVIEWGRRSLSLWPKLITQLDREWKEIGYTQQGSLFIAHRRDFSLWQEAKAKIITLISDKEWAECLTKDLEPELGARFDRAFFLKNEAHLNPHLFLKHSFDYLHDKVAAWHHASLQDINSKNHEKLFNEFDWVIDCRGIAARKEMSGLRAVRGEALLVRAENVDLKRPIRFMHPRYGIYIVPYENQTFYIGATQIESASNRNITVRSTLELLSAAFAIDPSFAEAEILDTRVGLRPAFPDHLPRLVQKNRIIQINGLFRHGYLLSPFLAEETLRLITTREPRGRHYHLPGANNA